jgi:hypothetical protein
MAMTKTEILTDGLERVSQTAHTNTMNDTNTDAIELAQSQTRSGEQAWLDPEWYGMKPEDWDEGRTPWKPVLVLRAETYLPDRLFDVAPCHAEHLSGNYRLSPKESLAYQNRILPKGMPLQLLGHEAGFVVWTDDIVIPTLVDTSRHCRSGKPFLPSTSEAERVAWGAVWMSLTPSEMMTQRSGVLAAKGIVVLGGLGLGWLLGKVCAKDSVERVVVVEKSQELLDWYGYGLCRKFRKVSDVICDDVYNQIGKHGGATYLLDIWHLLSGAGRDERLIKAKRRFKNRLWGWGWDERRAR